ncbi:MAG TPA: bifunctional glutamate N-acetyltransferase/amino-acid acetyltransferase ArgJ [Acidimicrobiales bacterium]|nr:bifunctional glutamate N-acetyltransferase/amino-acid acetyltransferase ArgJ [Acidimicrobiales bacterium]
MSITTPKGFVASGLASGIKASGAFDLALLATDDGLAVPAAATFTTNLAAAAPVQVSRDHLAATGGRAAAVVVSSGNANAATGAEGKQNAARMCELVASGLAVSPEEVLVCSTGLISFQLPMEPIESGIPDLVAARSGSAQAAEDAATGILTTDSGRKEALVRGSGFSVAGMAKGAGMIAPNMATMLAFLTTDADIEPGPLADLLRIAVRDSFNSLTIDGCTSTNDTVTLMASGRSGPADPNVVVDAVTEVCADLAAQMAADAEGASKIAHVRVTGAESDGQAHRAARKVAESMLVKCSLNGADPYWGRIASELGSAGVAFDIDKLTIAYGGVVVCRGGLTVDHDQAAVTAHLEGSMVDLHCELNLADGNGMAMTVDLGYGYIDENRTTS